LWKFLLGTEPILSGMDIAVFYSVIKPRLTDPCPHYCP
jgi:hypothetical protein